MTGHQRKSLPCTPKGQGGSILVQFALILGVLIAILGIVDVGYMYYAKRDLQRIADLAALEAVRGLDSLHEPERACPRRSIFRGSHRASGSADV